MLASRDRANSYDVRCRSTSQAEPVREGHLSLLSSGSIIMNIAVEDLVQGVRSGPALDAVCEGMRVEEREDHGDKEGSECSIEARFTGAASSARSQGRTVSYTTRWAESSSRTRPACSAPHHAQVVSE